MGIKAAWRGETVNASPLEVPLSIESIIDRAAHLTGAEIVQLDAAEARGRRTRLVAWDLLRDRVPNQARLATCVAAESRAWAAVNRSLASLDVMPLPEGGYWRVTSGLGWGAARAVRFVTAALLLEDVLEPEPYQLLIEPWHHVIRPTMPAPD